tara:strand:+ start:1014 stop:1574 length:561 start_codon:yes stop_codon:yes gene_type:complete
MALSKIKSASIDSVGTIVSSNLPSKSILQVVTTSPTLNGVSVANSYAVHTSGTTWTSYVANGYYVDITPSATSSKILILANHPSYNNTSGHTVFFVFKRSIDGGTYSDPTNFDSSQTYDAQGFTRANVGGDWDYTTYQGLDSPNTTSAIRYGLHMKTSSGTGIAGWSNSSFANHNISMITAMEIKG